MSTPPQLRHHVKPPQPFDHEDKTTKWKLWKSMFKNYMTASNYSALPCADKRAILLANLHPKVFESFEDLPENDTYEKAIAALEKYFGERYSKIFAVHNFRKLRQEAGQDIQQFVSILKSSSKECNVGAAADSEIKQQLISAFVIPR